MALCQKNAHNLLPVATDNIYSKMRTSQDDADIPLTVASDTIFSEFGIESHAFIQTHTTATKKKIRRIFVIATIIALITIIGVLSCILILQNSKEEHREKEPTNQQHLVCPNTLSIKKDTKPRGTSENFYHKYLICFTGNHGNAANIDKSVYIVAENDFELDIFDKDLNSTATYFEVETQMAHVKKMNVPHTMMLSYFKIENKALLIQTTHEASVIIIDDYKLSSDSTMILPVKYLSNSYVISTIQHYKPKHRTVQFAIAALNNSTKITILFRIEPNVPFTVDGIDYQSGSEMVIHLNELETYQIRHTTDLSGTLINASSSVAVFSGNRCEKIDLENKNNSGFCSQLVEQIPPIDRLDNTYIAPPNINRYGTILKVVSPFVNHVTYTVGKTNKTVFLLPREHFEITITEKEVAVIESERPVLVTSFAAGSDTSGDPYMITIPGVTQYLSEYTVVTPSNFTSNYVTLMIEDSSLSHLTINGRGLSEHVATFHGFVTVRKIRYIVLVMHVSDAVINLKTSNNAVFGVLVYGHRKSDGHGFAGNVVLPDACVP